MCLVNYIECGLELDHDFTIRGRCCDCDVDYKLATGAFT